MSNTSTTETKLSEQQVVVILRHLLNGGEWKYKEHVFVLSDDMQLCTIAYLLDASKGVTSDNFELFPASLIL